MAESFIGVRRKPCRQVQGSIQRAMLTTAGPFPEPKRLKGSRSKGLTYERKFGKMLRRWMDSGYFYEGQLFQKHWINFEDDNGVGWAQPDYFILTPDAIWIFELKLSQNSGAWEQLRGLYGPLLEHLFRRDIVRVQVCKNLIEHDGTVVNSIDALGDGCTFHWLDN